MSVISFTDLKQTPNGKIVYTNRTNNNLEVVNEQMDTVAVVDARGSETLEETRAHLMSSSSTEVDDYIFLWTAGGGVLGIVDSHRMEYDMVEGLGGAGVGEALPVALVSHSYGRKVMTITTKKLGNVGYANYWSKTGGGRVVTRGLDYIDKELQYVDSIDVVLDGSVALLCGGGDERGLVVATSFDGHFDYVNKLEFDAVVSRIKRWRKSNVFMVGSYSIMYVLQYKDAKMSKLCSISNASSGLISWIEVVNNEVYVLDRTGSDLRKIIFNSSLEHYVN